MDILSQVLIQHLVPLILDKLPKFSVPFFQTEKCG